jgi:GH25 family lysozyme M1 (1,4-beta-N-acetylmuramidase)
MTSTSGSVRRRYSVLGLVIGALLVGSAVPASASASTQLPGLDVGSYEGDVDWRTVVADGATFAYVQATQGTTVTNPYFTQQYNGARDAGLVRGAYDVAYPSGSSGPSQADYFIAHGGAWSADGHTLPGAVDIEWNPYGATCYGLSHSAMAAWIQSFADEYQAQEGVLPVIATATSWWDECVGSAGELAADPLWIESGGTTAGTLPAGWTTYTFWHQADPGVFPGGQDAFNGTEADLLALAGGAE